MNKKIVIGALVIIVVSFFGGLMYGKSTTPNMNQFANSQFAGNQNRTAGVGMRNAVGGGLTAGEIISKDSSGVTIKMQDGSTKIVLIATSTQVMKSSAGSINDLTTGTSVTITGKTNSDGSISAQSVQLRPAGSMQFGGTRVNQ